MAEQGILLRVGADVVEVTKSLNQVEAEIKELEKAIKSLSGGALVSANKELDKLALTKKALQNVGRTGFDQFGAAINKVGASAVGATPALNSLGQVARDLPFGFIAIQNNLPIVVDQFTALTRASGGIGGALRGVGAALLGPAGLAFAFGAVTAGVTALIQKYGSFGAAIDALVSNGQKLSKAQQEIADGITDELAQVTLLVSLYPQLEGRRNEQDKLLKKLNQSAPTYFRTLNSEQTTVEQLTAAYDKYTRSLLGKIFIESQQERLREIAKQYAQDLIRLNDAQVKGAQQRDVEANKTKKLVRETQSAVDAIKDLRAVRQQAAGDIGIGISLAPVTETFEGAIANLLESFRKQADQILKGTDNIVKQLDFGSVFADNVIPDPKKTKEKVDKFGEELNNALKNLKINALADVLNFEDVKPIEIPAEVKIKPPTKEEIQAALGPDDVRVFEFKSQGVDVALRDFNNYRTELDKLSKSTAQAGGLTKALFDSFAASNKDFTTGAIQNFTALNERVQGVVKNFNDFLAPAINTVFGALENGKSIPQALGQAFKALITQLALTVVKAAALAAILSVITGGTASAPGFSKIFTSLLGFTGGGNVAAPAFGGVQGGAFGLQGQVVFTQRGSDLVGVLNNTNGQIRRVG